MLKRGNAPQLLYKIRRDFTMKKIVAALVFAGLTFGTVTAFADTDTTTTKTKKTKAKKTTKTTTSTTTKM
jgi:hypothetical protein